jgi:hypothetical protein
MATSERRVQDKQRLAEMKRELNDDQLNTLRELEMFGWELKFIRHKPFAPGIPVVFDGDRKKFAVLREDGTLDDKPGFDIRH